MDKVDGYREEGWVEWADSFQGEHPQYVDIIMMEDVLGIPNRKFKITESEKAWAYYRELKAQFEAQQRKTA